MNAVPDYTPEPGCLAGRVLDLFSRNADVYFTSPDLALKFNVVTSGIKQRLEAPLNHGLLLYQRAGDEPSSVWHIGPNFKAWHAAQQRAGAASAVLPKLGAASTAAKPPRKATGPRVPVDVAALAKVHRKLPLPAGQSTRGTSPYADLWASLQDGDCVELPDRNAHSMASWAKNNKLQVATRRLSPTTKGVWKLPTTAGATA